MDKLFTLLELQRQAMEAQTRAGLLHVIVNDTRRLIPYDQALFISMGGLLAQIEKISGNASVDQDGIYATAVKSAVSQLARSSAAGGQASLVPLDPAEHQKNGAVLLFGTAEEGHLGALWIEHTKAYGEAETRILEEICVTYSRALALWKLRERKIWGLSARLPRSAGWITGGLLLALAFFPVRLTVTAPAEIVPKDAAVVTIPFDGMVEDVLIDPGDEVKKEDVLLRMEQQSLKAQMDLAEQEMRVVQSSLSRAQRESLAAPDRKANLIALQQEIESKKIEYNHAKILTERADIRAARDGVAVFSDAASLRGKPVQAGEKVMMVANPQSYQLLIRVPVDSMIGLDPKAPVTFFLHTSPLSAQRASIESIGYQAGMDPDGLLTYKIVAVMDKNDDNIRIGWKATAKIRGEWTTLSYAILRRPMIALRNLLGV